VPIAGLRHAPPGDDHFSPATGRRPAYGGHEPLR
jgi:hypothetical protein